MDRAGRVRLIFKLLALLTAELEDQIWRGEYTFLRAGSGLTPNYMVFT